MMIQDPSEPELDLPQSPTIIGNSLLRIHINKQNAVTKDLRKLRAYPQ